MHGSVQALYNFTCRIKLSLLGNNGLDLDNNESFINLDVDIGVTVQWYLKESFTIKNTPMITNNQSTVS